MEVDVGFLGPIDLFFSVAQA